MYHLIIGFSLLDLDMDGLFDVLIIVEIFIITWCRHPLFIGVICYLNSWEFYSLDILLL